MIADRAIRARINQLSHQIGQRAAQEARQRIADRLQSLRAAGADRAALESFLVLCERIDDIADLLDL